MADGTTQTGMSFTVSHLVCVSLRFAPWYSAVFAEPRATETCRAEQFLFRVVKSSSTVVHGSASVGVPCGRSGAHLVVARWSLASAVAYPGLAAIGRPGMQGGGSRAAVISTHRPRIAPLPNGERGGKGRVEWTSGQGTEAQRDKGIRAQAMAENKLVDRSGTWRALCMPIVPLRILRRAFFGSWDCLSLLHCAVLSRWSCTSSIKSNNGRRRTRGSAWPVP